MHTWPPKLRLPGLPGVGFGEHLQSWLDKLMLRGQWTWAQAHLRGSLYLAHHLQICLGSVLYWSKQIKKIIIKNKNHQRLKNVLLHISATSLVTQSGTECSGTAEAKQGGSQKLITHTSCCQLLHSPAASKVHCAFPVILSVYWKPKHGW